MLIIEFPRKYNVRHDGANMYTVSAPRDIADEVLATIKSQPWISTAHQPWESGKLSVYVSYAYDVSTEQAIGALGRICEHIMEPQPEMDTELEHELEELL